MSGENTGGEGAESARLNSERTSEPSERPDAMACIKLMIPAFVLILIIALIIAVIVLTVRIHSRSSLYLASQNVSCTDSWITYKGKYFYIAREKKDWFMSLKTCSLLNSSLAVIDTQKELDFWVHFLGPFDYWFGLSRENNKVWKWANGTEFRNQFPIHGEGFCAYINEDGASSTKCTVEKGFLCSCNGVAAILAKATSSKVGSS